MGLGERRRLLRSADLAGNHGYAPGGGLVECGPKGFGLPDHLAEQTQKLGVVDLERVIHVLVHRDANFLAGADDGVEVDARIEEPDFRERGAGVGDVGSVAIGAQVRLHVREGRVETRHAVDDAHAVAAVDRHVRVARELPQALEELAVRIVRQVTGVEDHRRAGARFDGGLELRLQALTRHAQNREIGCSGEFAKRAVAGQPLDGLVLGIDGIDGALVVGGLGDLDQPVTGRTGRLGSAHIGDRAGVHEGIEAMFGHGGIPEFSRQPGDVWDGSRGRASNAAGFIRLQTSG